MFWYLTIATNIILEFLQLKLALMRPKTPRWRGDADAEGVAYGKPLRPS
jgi:hypothetical protein